MPIITQPKGKYLIYQYDIEKPDTVSFELIKKVGYLLTRTRANPDIRDGVTKPLF